MTRREPPKGPSAPTLAKGVNSQDTPGGREAVVIPFRLRQEQVEARRRHDYVMAALAEAKRVIEAALASGDPEVVSDAAFIGHRTINLAVGELLKPWRSA